MKKKHQTARNLTWKLMFAERETSTDIMHLNNHAIGLTIGLLQPLEAKDALKQFENVEQHTE